MGIERCRSSRAEAGSEAPKGLEGTLRQPLHCLIYRQYHKSRGPATTRNITSFAGMETCSTESGDFPVTLLPPEQASTRPGPTRDTSVLGPIVCPPSTQSHRPSRMSPLSLGRSLEGAQDTSVARRALPDPACCGGGEEAVHPVSRLLRTGGSEDRSPRLGRWTQPRSGALGLCSAPGCPHGQQRKTVRTAGSHALRSALSTDNKSEGKQENGTTACHERDHQQHPSPPRLSGLKFVCQEETDCTEDTPEKVHAPLMPERALRGGPHTPQAQPPPPQTDTAPPGPAAAARHWAAEWRSGCAETVQRIGSQQPKAADPEALPWAHVHGLSTPPGPPRAGPHTHVQTLPGETGLPSETRLQTAPCGVRAALPWGTGQALTPLLHRWLMPWGERPTRPGVC